MRYAISVVMLALGCATVPPVASAAPGWKLLNASPGAQEIQIRSDTQIRRATVTEAGARGPDFDVKRVGGRLQGVTYVDRPVDMQQKGNNEIHGRVASESWDLTLSQDGTEVRATGLIGGGPATFWMSPPKIRGSVGVCQFELVWSASNYAGARNCGPLTDMVQLQIPAGLASWSDPEVAALLAIFLQK